MCFKTPQQANEVGLYAQGANALFSAFSAAGAARREKAAYSNQARIAEFNASAAERAAADAIDRGHTEASAVVRKGRQIKGAQRAVLAAGNVDQSFGSALDVLTETDVATDIDANTAHANAEREAYALRVRGASYQGEAELMRYRARSTSPLLAGSAALLDGVSTVASRWYAWKEKGLLTEKPKGGKSSSASFVGPRY